MGDVTPLRPKGPWVVVCPECGNNTARLFEDKVNLIQCARCGEFWDMSWFELGDEAG